MENQEKIPTDSEYIVNNVPITDALDAFNILLKIGIKNGMSIPEISAKTGINKQSLYRYSSDFESQKRSNPSISTLLKLADALGYEIRAIKKYEENVDKK